MSHQSSDEKDELIEQMLFTHSDIEDNGCSTSCKWHKMIKKLEQELNNKDKQINKLKIKDMENEEWKKGMVKRWDSICSQNEMWCKDYIKIEGETVDLESEIAKLQQKLTEQKEKSEDQQEENADLQRKHDVAVMALKQLVNGIRLLTRGDKDVPINQHVKAVNELTKNIFAEFVNDYCNVDLDM